MTHLLSMLAILLFLTWDDILHIIVYLRNHSSYSTNFSYRVFRVHVDVVLSLHKIISEQKEIAAIRHNYLVVVHDTCQRSLPMGYSFLGHEPDPFMCCNLSECTVWIQLNLPEEITYKRLNCGHYFHVTCLQPRDPVHGPFVPNSATCPIWNPLLEERIRELSTTMNRWVPGFEKN